MQCCFRKKKDWVTCGACACLMDIEDVCVYASVLQVRFFSARKDAGGTSCAHLKRERNGCGRRGRENITRLLNMPILLQGSPRSAAAQYCAHLKRLGMLESEPPSHNDKKAWAGNCHAAQLRYAIRRWGQGFIDEIMRRREKDFTHGSAPQTTQASHA